MSLFQSDQDFVKGVSLHIHGYQRINNLYTGKFSSPYIDHYVVVTRYCEDLLKKYIVETIRPLAVFNLFPQFINNLSTAEVINVPVTYLHPNQIVRVVSKIQGTFEDNGEHIITSTNSKTTYKREFDHVLLYNELTGISLKNQALGKSPEPILYMSLFHGGFEVGRGSLGLKPDHVQYIVNKIKENIELVVNSNKGE